MAKKNFDGIASTGIRVVDGRFAFVCPGHISVVSALAIAVPAVSLNAAAHRLDSEHYSYLLCLASARAGTAVAGSWLDHAAGIRSHRNGRCDDRASPLEWP